MRKIMMAGLLAAALAGSARAELPAAVDGDLRCVAVMSAAVGDAQGDKRTQLAVAVMYFVGRLDGEAPELDLTTEMKRIVPGLTDDVVRSEGQRCGAVLTGAGTRLQKLGADLQADGKPADK